MIGQADQVSGDHRGDDAQAPVAAGGGSHTEEQGDATNLIHTCLYISTNM